MFRKQFLFLLSKTKILFLHYSSRQRHSFSNPTKRFPLLKLYSSSKESRLQGNLTFLAKPDATASEAEKEKKENIASYLQKLRSCGHRCRSQRILGVRYEVLHLGFLSPR
ncbi:hypothetical protein CEXT_46561 [Caerostris extrusa]|uniref:Uncharacterized protein n=1 Tax=Caerostris extrusa TaxID=172846 RepID=A0AAV4MTV9_CAEEX|nr:hypothetical protein CEXT_46561 [Caerostris extrusa]